MIQLENPLNLTPNTNPNGDDNIFENKDFLEPLPSIEEEVLPTEKNLTLDSEPIDLKNTERVEGIEIYSDNNEALQSDPKKETIHFQSEGEVEKSEISGLEAYLSHLNEMFNGKQQYMMEMIEILLSQIPETSQKMKAAILLENWEEVFFQSHRIKSTLKIVGLQDLVKICLGIESRTRIIVADELHLVPGLFEQFEALCQKEIPHLEAAVAYLKNQLENESPSPIIETTSDDLNIMFLP